GSLYQQNRYQNLKQNFAPKQNFHKQVGFQLPSTGSNNQLRTIPQSQVNQSMQKNDKIFSLGKNNGPKDNEPIKGQAIFNNTLVNYMCDSGADITVIDVKTYSLIKRHAPESYLEDYRGGKLYSASGEIYIYGLLRLNRCLIAPGISLNNTNVIVTNNCSGHQCLIGRDIINRIPALKQRIDSIKSIFREYSTGVLKIFRDEMKKKRCRNQNFLCDLNRRVNSQQLDLTQQKKENYFPQKTVTHNSVKLQESKKEIKNELPNSCESKTQ
ncbi:unnamed protein product, partial [Brachionus calyciflorus]